MAIVRTCDGNAPSEKPYFTPQAASKHRARLLGKDPNRWIKRNGVFGPDDDEIELAAADLVAISNASVGEPVDPFYYPAAIDAFDSTQRIAHKGQTPSHRDSNVGTQRVAVNTSDGVRHHREGQPPECRPE